VGAGAATLTWVTRLNMTDLRLAGPAQRGEKVDRFTFQWEGALMAATTDRSLYRDGLEVSVNVHRMFFESLERKAFQDAGMLVLGYFIVFLYVFLMLGKYSWVEQRFYLSVGGILGIAMGIFARYLHILYVDKEFSMSKLVIFLGKSKFCYDCKNNQFEKYRILVFYQIGFQ